jgi:hypothetical protein
MSRLRKRQVNWDKVRERLTSVVVRSRGSSGVGSAEINWLVAKTGISRSAWRRFFQLIPSSKTDALQAPSIRKICLGLDLDENWLLHGVEARQKGIWPASVSAEATNLHGQDPVQVLTSALEGLVQMQDRNVQILLGRAALIALLEAAGTHRVVLPAACYSALVWFEESRNVA